MPSDNDPLEDLAKKHSAGLAESNQQRSSDDRRLRIGYILNAIELSNSFARQAKAWVGTRDPEKAQLARERAEAFYRDACEMLETTKDCEMPSLMARITELRSVLDELYPSAYGTSA